MTPSFPWKFSTEPQRQEQIAVELLWRSPGWDRVGWEEDRTLKHNVKPVPLEFTVQGAAMFTVLFNCLTCGLKQSYGVDWSRTSLILKVKKLRLLVSDV